MWPPPSPSQRRARASTSRRLAPPTRQTTSAARIIAPSYDVDKLMDAADLAGLLMERLDFAYATLIAARSLVEDHVHASLSTAEEKLETLRVIIEGLAVDVRRYTDAACDLEEMIGLRDERRERGFVEWYEIARRSDEAVDRG